jgi:hypothetical protein
MDRPRCHWQISSMPAPITKLSDRFADYTLRIRCKKCQHERTADPHALAKLMGWETPLAEVAARMRCSRCNARGECELTALNQSKPRSYRSDR